MNRHNCNQRPPISYKYKRIVFSFELEVIYVIQVVVIYYLCVQGCFFEQYKDVIIMVSMNDEVVTMIHQCFF